MPFILNLPPLADPGSVSEPMSKSQRDYDLHMLRQRRLREIKEKAKLKEVCV